MASEEAYVIVVDCLDLDSDIPLTKRQQALVDRVATAITAARAEQREVDAKIAESWEHEDKVNPSRYIAKAIRAGKE